MNSPVDLMVEMLVKEGSVYLTVLGKTNDPPIEIKKDAEGKFCYRSRQFVEPLLAILIAIAEQGGIHRIFSYSSEPI